MDSGDREGLAAIGLDRYVDTREAAKILGLSPKYLCKLRVCTGEGPRFSRFSYRVCRYKVRDLIAWADARAATSTSQLAA